MNLLITSGMDERWCEYAHDQLLRVGLSAPKYGERTGMTAEQLTNKMSAAYPVRRGRREKTAAEMPGKAWEIAASDLVLANAENNVWGWSAPGALNHLNFWSEFEPNSRFLLIYGAAHEALSSLLIQPEMSAERVDEYISDWIHYHERLLQFYHENSDRSLLVHIHELESSNEILVDELNARFGVSFSTSEPSIGLERSALNEVLGQVISAKSTLAHSLYNELNNSADLPRVRSNTAAARDGLIAAEELYDLRRRTDETEALSAETKQLKLDLQTTRKELELANGNLARANSDLKVHRSQNALLTVQLQQLSSEIDKRTVSSTIQDTSGEQVHAEAPAANPKLSDQNHDVCIDMTKMISGQGWHDAEDHGRWAGASPRSIVRLPDLATERYLLTASIVDTISHAHLKDLELYFDENRLAVSLKIFSNIGGRLAPLRRIRADLARHPKPVPAEVSAYIPAEWIGSGQKAHILTISSAPAIRPTELGMSDPRPLTVCLDRIELRVAT